MIDAGLGRKEEALREGRRACELLPISKDAIDGVGLAVYLAQIYAWVGEKDLAIEQIAAVERLPNSLSYGFLKLRPNGIRCGATRASRKSSHRSRRNNRANFRTTSPLTPALLRLDPRFQKLASPGSK